MARAILICGALCCGKSTYARRLCAEQGAVLLSIDELMLAMYEPYLGDRHDECAQRAREYLLSMARRLCGAGVDVVLDWGFWTRESRQEAKRFFDERGVRWELHFISVPDGEWQRRICARNADVAADRCSAYLVDEGLMRKFMSAYQPPAQDEVTVWVHG